MKIYNASGTILLDITVSDESCLYREIMGKDSLTLSFALTSFIEIPVGAYCVFQGLTYYLLKPGALKLQHTRYWEYSLTMETYAGLLETIIYQNPDDKRLTFSAAGPAAAHLDLLVRCINKRRSGWSFISNIDTSLEVNVGYDFANCKEALQQIADGFETEWEIDGKCIVLGKVEHGKTTPISMAYGKGNGFLSGVERTNYNDELPISSLFVQGGDTNIDYASYGSKTLMMPKGVTVGYDGEKFSWEDDYDSAKAKAFTTDADGASVTVDGVETECDGALDCADIYPKRVGEVTGVTVVSEEKNLYDFVDNTIPLSLDFAACTTSETMTVIFQTGALAGREFDVAFVKSEIVNGVAAVVNRFEIVPATIDETDMPSASFAPAVGDKYAVFHVSLPASYINDADTHSGAEWDILRKAVDYLYDACQMRFSISGTMDGIWSRQRWDSVSSNLVPGGYISFTDTRFQPEPFLVRITAVRQYVNRPYSPEITLSNGPTSGGVTSSIREVKSDVTIAGDSINAGLNYTRRRFRDVKETADALKDAMDSLDVEFDESIKPITIQTMQGIVGDDGLQYWFTASLISEEEIDPPIAWDSSAKKLSCGLSYILHKTIGVTEVRADGSAGSRWTVSAAELTADREGNTLGANTLYYLYIAAGTDGTASFVLSKTALALSPSDGTHNFLVGILNSEYKGTRSFAPMYGYTEITPGRMTVDRIVSNDGDTYFDLVNGVIGGNMQFKSGSSGLENLSEWEEKQKQIDSAASTASAAKSSAEAASASVAKLGSGTVFTLLEKRSVRETMLAISSIKGEVVPPYGTVAREPLSGQAWQEVTDVMAEATPALADFVGWRRSQIAGTASGQTVEKVTFAMSVAADITVEFCSDAETTYDYLVAAAMDEATALTRDNAATLAEVSTKGAQGIANKVTKVYSLTAGTHTLQILYLKDSGTDKGTDSGYYRILSEEDGLLQSGAGTFHTAYAEALAHGMDSKAAELASRASSLSVYLSETCGLWKDTDTEFASGMDFRNDLYTYLRNYLETQSVILSETPASDYAFLTKVFRDGSTTIAGGLVMTNMVGVTDTDGAAVTAGLNGSSLGADSAHGKLMVFAGSASGQETDVKAAHTRIYEDGTIVTDRIAADGGTFTDVVIIGTIRNPFSVPADSFDTDFNDNVAHISGGSLSYAYTIPCNVKQSGRVVRVVNWKWGGNLQSGTSSVGLADSGCAFLEDGIRKKELYLSREAVTLLGYGDSSRFYGWIVLQRTDLMTEHAYGRRQKTLAQGVIQCGSSPSFVSGATYTFDGESLSVERTADGIYKVTVPSSWGLNDSGYIVQTTPIGKFFTAVTAVNAGYFTVQNWVYTASYTDKESTDVTLTETPYSYGQVQFIISNPADFNLVPYETSSNRRADPAGTTATGGGKLTVTVTPTSASVKIDGTAVTLSGGSATVELSYGSHTVEVSASGYATQTMAVTIGDTDITKAVTLVEKTLTGLTVSGPSSVRDSGQFSISYSPSDVLSTYQGVTWSVILGSAYASIDSGGKMIAKDGAKASSVTVQATSSWNTSIIATKTVSVTYAAGPDISFDESSLNVTAGSTSATMRFQYMNIEQLEATISGNLSGASVSVGKLDDNDCVFITFDANADATAKAGTVTVSGQRTDGGGQYSASFVITQAAASSVETYLTVSPTTISAPADKAQFGTGGEFSISANQSWTAEVISGDSWLDVDDTGNTGDLVNSAILLTSNTGSSSRSGVIRITGADGTTVDIRVTQAAAEAEVVNPSIDSTSFVLSGEGASRTLNVSDPQSRGWRLTSSVSWATLSQSSGTGAAAVTVTAAASTSTTTTRTGYVYLWDSTGATKLATLTLTQAPTSVVALTGLAISGEDTGDYGVYLKAVYTPSDTTQIGVQWSIVSGNDYASIGATEGGDEITVTINPVGNVGKTFTVRCTSTANSAIYAEKTITIVEGTVADWSIAGPTALTAYSAEEYQYSIDWGDILEQDVTWSVENAGTSAYPYATINSSTGVLKQGLKAYQMSSGSSGTFQVRATLADGEYKEIDVTITKK